MFKYAFIIHGSDRTNDNFPHEVTDQESAIFIALMILFHKYFTHLTLQIIFHDPTNP